MNKGRKKNQSGLTFFHSNIQYEKTRKLSLQRFVEKGKQNIMPSEVVQIYRQHGKDQGKRHPGAFFEKEKLLSNEI